MAKHAVVFVPIELRGTVGWPYLVVERHSDGNAEAVAGFRKGSDAFEEMHRRNGEEES